MNEITKKNAIKQDIVGENVSPNQSLRHDRFLQILDKLNVEQS